MYVRTYVHMYISQYGAGNLAIFKAEVCIPTGNLGTMLLAIRTDGRGVYLQQKGCREQ